MTVFTESSSGLADNGDGTFKIVLITPGQGSSAFYTEDMLKTYGPGAFPKGTQSYLDHPDDPQNPKRSPKDIIGVLTEAASYEDGVGLVSRLKPFKHFKEFVEEVREYVGMSVFVEGESHIEEIDGNQVRIAESLTPNIVNTVDLVSYAGRGGHFAESLLQAALEDSQATDTTHEEDEQMALSDEKAEALIASIDALISLNTSLTESLKDKNDATIVEDEKASKAVLATVAVESADISKSMKDALLEDIKAGNYEVDAKIEQFKTIYAEAVEAAKTQYLSEGIGTILTTSTTNTPTEVEGW